MDYKIGETFEWDSKVLKTVAGTNERFTCDYCYFNNSPDCLLMDCASIERADGTNVHFEVVNEKRSSNHE